VKQNEREWGRLRSDGVMLPNRLGEDDRHIGTVDADGVALGAIQGLYELVKEKEAENAALQKRVDDLEARLKALEMLTKDAISPR